MLQDKIVFKNYVEKELIGQGAFSDVYLVEEEKTHEK